MTLTVAAQVQAGSLGLDATVEVEPGETVAIVGPNGAGKTTLLRTLAGLLPLDSGRIDLDGTVLDDPAADVLVPAERRPVGVVFQDYLLFPHLSVTENVAFGLRSRGTRRARARRVARDRLADLGMAELADAPVHVLSGGQAQRVALARALVTRPRLLLLDEPFAALDATGRASARRGVRRDLDAFDGIAVLVTHDLLDAAALADRIVVLEAGRVVQTGTLADAVARPRSDYVADLVGTNLLRGHARGDRVVLDHADLPTTPREPNELVVADARDGPVFASIHPHAVTVHRNRPETSARNVWSSTIAGIEQYGGRARIRFDGPVPLVAEITEAAIRELGLGVGVAVWVSVKATEITVFAA